ncbi:metalloprotease PmbA [Methylogaea oryzae]|nr:metalloprotease PmbA [Methylogaea oryzae]
MNDKPDMGEEQARLLGLVEDLLREAKAQGASGAEAAISVDRGLSVSARLGEVETIEHHCDQGLGLTVYIGQRKGSASSTDLSPQSIRDTVAAACRIARYAAEDEYAGLPEPETLATAFPELDLYHPWDLDAGAAVALAIECEDAGRQLSPEISNSDGASLSTHQGFRVLGNSLGFLHGYATSRHSLSCALVGQRGDDMQRDYWYTSARAAGDLEPAAAVGRKAAERTLRRLEGRSLTTRQCPVLFSAEVASGLLGHFIGAIRGGNLYRKSSFLLDCLGKPVFPPFVQLQEQPHLPRAVGSAPYDSEGVATRSKYLVKDGVLCSYVLSTYSARKLGMKTTGNAGGVHNLVIEPGRLDLPGLLAAMGTGLLVTELMGQGVNLVTGDYSRGAAGFWVENGEIQYPVEEITIAGNLREMLAGIVAVGNDVDGRGNTRTGSVLVANMTVAGN